jgi:hypothetical protein
VTGRATGRELPAATAADPGAATADLPTTAAGGIDAPAVHRHRTGRATDPLISATTAADPGGAATAVSPRSAGCLDGPAGD